MFYTVIDILGTIAFSISGVLVAMDKKMDPFGLFIIAFVTAVGGGTLRDLLIGQSPVFWLTDMTYSYIIIASTVFAIIFRTKLSVLRKSLFLFDAVGIGLYTIMGIEKGLLVGLNPFICIGLGTMSACFGGVIRDTLCNEIPVIFRQEVYATACIAGGVVYFVLSSFNVSHNLALFFGGMVVIIVRLLAVKFKISLPKVY